MTDVAVCDDRDQVREGLARVLGQVSGVGRADCVSHADAIGWCSEHPVDLVLVGVQRERPGGVDAVRSLTRVRPRPDVVVFGSPDDVASIIAGFAAGACGFLRWDTAHPEWLLSMVSRAAGRRDRNRDFALSPQESRILEAISQGNTTTEIAGMLHVPEGAVKASIRVLFRKLDVEDRTSAVAKGFRYGILP